MAHDATRPQRLWLIGTPGRDRRRLRVQVRTQSKSIECSFNVVSIVLPQCRFNVVYSADRPLMANVYTFRVYNYCKQATSYLDGVISAGIIYTYI